MSNKHTPGPWTAHALMVSEEGQPIGRFRDICHCGIGMRAPSDAGQAEANARLIAAAPELLEALHGARREIAALVAALGEGLCTASVLKAADAAIAKATGEGA